VGQRLVTALTHSYKQDISAHLAYPVDKSGRKTAAFLHLQASYLYESQYNNTTLINNLRNDRVALHHEVLKLLENAP